MIYIFDLHMTLADTRHRMKDGAHEWTDEEIMKDEATLLFRCFYEFLNDSNAAVIISTASSSKYTKQNIAWLEKILCKDKDNYGGRIGYTLECFFPKNHKEWYFCRSRSTEDKDLTDAEVKRKNLQLIKAKYPEEKNFLVFDDDLECIKMYKEEGCKTCLVDVK